MSPKAIEQARDADLRFSRAALLRAAQRARELAVRTGTALVVSGQRGIEKIQPVADSSSVQEPAAPYGDAT